MGRAINKAVTIAEILKRKMPLHQITSLTSCEIVDVFEPLEEGLDVVESRRFVSCMIITLSRDGEGMDLKDIGYQVSYVCAHMHATFYLQFDTRYRCQKKEIVMMLHLCMFHR
mmetsp:Transcript_60542/g.89817  ORF Transcript_60542/g.89817 Transcript_60542/m.89817 type:complete len:113 (-) Transcript_60542:347-685(-)